MLIACASTPAALAAEPGQRNLSKPHKVFRDQTVDVLNAVNLEFKRLDREFYGADRRDLEVPDEQRAQLTAALRERFVELYRRMEQAYDLQLSDIRRFADRHKSAAPKCGAWASQMLAERPDFAAVVSDMAAAPLGSSPQDKLKVQGLLMAATLSASSSIAHGVSVAGGCVIEDVGSRHPPRSGTLPGPRVASQESP